MNIFYLISSFLLLFSFPTYGLANNDIGLNQQLDFKILVDRTWHSNGSDDSQSIKVFSSQSDLDIELSKYAVKNIVVDFSVGRVVMIDRGTFMSGGYSIELKSAINLEDHTQVEAIFMEPGENCLVTTVISNPLMFVYIPTTHPIEVITSLVPDPACEIPGESKFFKLETPGELSDPVTPTSLTPGSLVITVNTAYLREGPSIDHPIVLQLDHGQELVELKRQGNWLHVEASDETGWIHDHTVETEQP